MILNIQTYSIIVVYRRDHVLFTLFVFVYVLWCQTHCFVSSYVFKFDCLIYCLINHEIVCEKVDSVINRHKIVCEKVDSVINHEIVCEKVDSVINHEIVCEKVDSGGLACGCFDLTIIKEV